MIFFSLKILDILMSPRILGRMLCGLMSQNWNFLEEMVPITSGMKLTQRSTIRHITWSGAFFATSGPGQLTIIDGTMNTDLSQNILEENIHLSLPDLKLNHGWIMQATV